MVHRLLCLGACTLVVGCSAFRHDGAYQPGYSTVRGFSTDCDGRLVLKDIDGTLSGMSLLVPPGQHQGRILYSGRPFLSDRTSPQFLTCLVRSEHEFKFFTKAGRRYWFYVDEQQLQKPVITLLESNDRWGPESHSLAAYIRQISAHEDCYLDERYAGCFSPERGHGPF